MSRLISPFQMITDHCFPSLDTHANTHAQTIYPSSQPATNKFVHGTWERKASHFRTFITHIIWYLHLQCMEAEYNYRGKREGSALSVPGMRRIHVHNDRFWQQCQPQTILRHIYLSSVERYSDSGSQWWMRHRPTPDTYFSFSEQTMQTSEMNIAGWRNTGNTTHLASRRK